MDAPLLQELSRHVPPSGPVGYLNFSDGRPDPRWQRQLNDAHAFLAERGDPAPWRTLGDWLTRAGDELQASGASAFRDTTQARAVLGLAFNRVLPAYRAHHADLLAHQPDAALFTPFFLARACEAVLRQGPPWDETARIVTGAVNALNDYVGYRPVAVLETRAETDFYPHERVRPIPLYLRGVGVGYGPYADLIARAIDILQHADPGICAEAGFDFALLDELALDPRAYDHTHPANRRPNYQFGEWDPHHIDNQGRYRRFVLRQTTVDALFGRRKDEGGRMKENRSGSDSSFLLPPSSFLFEAAAVLAGTILMATGTTGPGPGAYDSTTTLATLVPRIARYRDRFYARLIATVPGEHGEQLRAEAIRLKQPFAGARQHLNQALARQRAVQVQDRGLALLFAEMGYPEASRRTAAQIPVASVRFLGEIRLRQTAARLDADRGQLASAARLLPEVEDLLERGIGCGALADPWNVLGFQGLFPLFPAREDAVRDPRIEELLEVVSRQFDLYARLLADAASGGAGELREALSRGMERFAGWWDRYATADVSDLPRVHGGERTEAARHVAQALARWSTEFGVRESGSSFSRAPAGSDSAAASAELRFWRAQREGFRSPAAFAQVIEALLKQRQWRAALALLMTWLGESGEVPLEGAAASFHRLAPRWLGGVLADGDFPDRAGLVLRFFELLEANADALWHIPDLTTPGRVRRADEEDENPFGAAYEGMSYRDSADDGEEGAVAGGGESGFVESEQLQQDVEALRLRLQFLETVAGLWRTAAGSELARSDADLRAAAGAWLATARGNRERLTQHLDRLTLPAGGQPAGSFEDVVELDRRRTLLLHLIDAALEVTVETGQAVRALAALQERGAEDMPADPEAAAGATSSAPRSALRAPRSWEPVAVAVEAAVGRGDAAAVRRLLPELLRTFGREPLLFVPPAEGGQPREVLRVREAQAFLQALVERLPALGLLRETYQLVKTARAMEANDPPEGPKVSDFERIFRTGMRAAVEGLLGVPVPADAAGPAGVELPVAFLVRAADAFRALWERYVQGVRLSVLEGIPDDEWQELRDFIRAYGRELFTSQFMILGNLRGILHQGVGSYLDALIQQGAPLKLLEDVEAGRVGRERAVRLLEVVLRAVAENYEEYRDYNTTTAQSDYGENLYVLLDFLRLKVRYERLSWAMRPLVLAHDVLCRRGRDEFAARWQELIAERCAESANGLLDDLARLEVEHSTRLRSVRDRLEERLVRPLLLDRLCARIGPAMRAARAGQDPENPDFARLQELLRPFAAAPTGSGLEEPHWLRRLGAEARRVADEWDEPDTPARRGVGLTVEELQRQLRDWERPITGEGE